MSKCGKYNCVYYQYNKYGKRKYNQYSLYNKS